MFCVTIQKVTRLRNAITTGLYINAVTKFILIFSAGLCLFPRPACGWNAEGHMVVAQIAYNHLNPVARAKCDTLIATPILYSSSYNNTFVTAACWADDIKSSTSAFNSWHFLAIPFSLDGTPTNGVGAAAFDVVRAIRTNISVLQNTSATLSNQAVHLRFLLHFVGDIQQPLHCSTAVSAPLPNGDSGGNGFALTGGWINLHFLWDNGAGYLQDSLLRPLNTTDQNTLNALVAAVEANHPYNYATNLGTIPDPLTWAQEGWALAQTLSYLGVTNATTPTASYLTTAVAATDELMAKGGHRLADLLNTIYPAPPIILTSTVLSNANIQFTWNAVTGGVYRVQWKSNLTDPVWNHLTNITASSNSVLFTDQLRQTQCFYRVMQ